MNESGQFIPQTDPKAGYLACKAAIDEAIRSVLESGRYILGPHVERFEQEFRDYLDVGFAVGVASGTDALEISLRALNIGSGDVVFTVANTAVATVAAVQRAGARLALVDVQLDSFTMDPQSLEETIEEALTIDQGRPRAVIPVHLYGQPADMKSILEVANRFELKVIEDCAQAHGARFDGKRVGTFGDLGAFSFYPTKNLGAIGDGGIVVTGNLDVAERLRTLREYGWKERQVSAEPGVNSRLDELQAAILLVKLPDLDRRNARRQELARLYRDRLSELSVLKLPESDGHGDHVYHLYVVSTSQRESLREFLEVERIGAAVHYPVPIHLQPAFEGEVMIAPGGLRHAELACKRVLSLPMFPELEESSLDRVVEAVKRWGKSAH